MKNFLLLSYFLHAVLCFEIQSTQSEQYDKSTEKDTEAEAVRDRRGIIEEEKFYSMHSDRHPDPNPWMPGSLAPEDDPNVVNSSMVNEIQEPLPMFHTTEKVTDKPTSRGARASNENWIKLPYPNQEDSEDILTPPQPSGDLINSRMPRVNFVTQNKMLDTSESRNDKEAIHRLSNEALRTEFIRPDGDRRKPVYPREAVFFPDDYRRPIYEDRFYSDDSYRREPYYEVYDRRPYFPGYAPRVDRYEAVYDDYFPRKPKRIIYYAHLPDVVRAPPSVDLRYRYSPGPYRRFNDDHMGARATRYDTRFWNKYPVNPRRKDERNYRDLLPAGTEKEFKKGEEKVTPTPVLPKNPSDDKSKSIGGRRLNHMLINSHQYHDSSETHKPRTLRNEDVYSMSLKDPYLRGIDYIRHRD